MTEQKAIETLSFEAAMEELEKIVKSLEQGNIPLDTSINAYERGIALKNHCEKKLKDAQSKIDKISVGKDGSISSAPLD